jgi:hypothetical protein
LGTQGKRKPKNIEDRYECWVCREYHGEKHDYASTEDLSKHERNVHEKPRGRREAEENQKPAKELEDAVKMLREIS